MYDDTCRFLAENFSADFASWLLGESITLTAASAILAGIKLEDEVVYRILRRDIMQESTVYRSILAEGEARKQREIAVNLLRRGITINIIASATGLSIEEVQHTTTAD